MPAKIALFSRGAVPHGTNTVRRGAVLGGRLRKQTAAKHLHLCQRNRVLTQVGNLQITLQAVCLAVGGGGIQLGMHTHLQPAHFASQRQHSVRAAIR